jgi:hypothetical protein
MRLAFALQNDKTEPANQQEQEQQHLHLQSSTARNSTSPSPGVRELGVGDTGVLDTRSASVLISIVLSCG